MPEKEERCFSCSSCSSFHVACRAPVSTTATTRCLSSWTTTTNMIDAATDASFTSSPSAACCRLPCPHANLRHRWALRLEESWRRANNSSNTYTAGPRAPSGGRMRAKCGSGAGRRGGRPSSQARPAPQVVVEALVHVCSHVGCAPGELVDVPAPRFTTACASWVPAFTDRAGDSQAKAWLNAGLALAAGATAWGDGWVTTDRSPAEPRPSVGIKPARVPRTHVPVA